MNASDSEKIYNASNAATTVRLSRFDKSYAKALLACDTTPETRLAASRQLISYLCRKYRIAEPRMTVGDFRPERGTTQTYGLYRRYDNDACTITVWNLTAKTHKPVAIKTFFGTLIHEFIHHYDHEVLKLGSSMHTAGFYRRVSDLSAKLLA